MEDVKEKIISLIDHQPGEALELVLQQLKANAREIAETAFGGWADMDDELYHDLTNGYYRRHPGENRELRNEEAMDN